MEMQASNIRKLWFTHSLRSCFAWDAKRIAIWWESEGRFLQGHPVCVLLARLVPQLDWSAENSQDAGGVQKKLYDIVCAGDQEHSLDSQWYDWVRIREQLAPVLLRHQLSACWVSQRERELFESCVSWGAAGRRELLGMNELQIQQWMDHEKLIFENVPSVYFNDRPENELAESIIRSRRAELCDQGPHAAPVANKDEYWTLFETLVDELMRLTHSCDSDEQFNWSAAAVVVDQIIDDSRK